MIDIRPTSPDRLAPVSASARRRRLRHRGTFRRPLQTVDRRIAVIGLGYVGLPLALSLLESGSEVEGLDIDEGRLQDLRAGRSPVDDVSADRLARGLRRGLAVRTPDDADLAAADVIIVCVPTPVTAANEPDLRAVEAAGRTIARSLRRGQLVILQSTSWPGTTTGPFRATLERSGLRAGIDVDLAFSPERVNPGDPASAGRSVPRLVGGLTPRSTRRAAALLRTISDRVVEVSSPEAAEMAKLLENTFRNVNIALVNHLALVCEQAGLDAWEVIDAAATKPFGFMPFRPGPGVGGHCIPVDPHYLAATARRLGLDPRLLAESATVNERMPGHVVRLVGQALDARGWSMRAGRVGIVGVAFKPGVRDARNSPAAVVLGGLTAAGAEVRYHDPHVPCFRDETGSQHESVDLASLVRWSDVVVVLTPHPAIDWDLVYADSELVVDTVDSSRGRTVRAGQVLRLGAGWGTRT